MLLLKYGYFTDCTLHLVSLFRLLLFYILALVPS